MQVVFAWEIRIKDGRLDDSAYVLEDGWQLVGIIHAKDNGPARGWSNQAK